MSHDDPYRPNTGHDYGRDRGAYTPPTDDDLPFNRGGYDPRGGRGGGGSGRGGPPVTLIISAVVLIALIVAVALYYRAGPRGSNDAPGAVGEPVGEMKADAPLDAQPIDPEAGIDVYAGAETPGAAPTFVPPPEMVQPRPAPGATPAPAAPSTRPGQSPVRPAPADVEITPPVVDPPLADPDGPPPAPAQRNAGVQIGAFSTPSLAQSEYAAVVGRYPQLTAGAQRRVQEVTASNGATVYRTTVSNLSREDARSLCTVIKASGGDCLVR